MFQGKKSNQDSKKVMVVDNKHLQNELRTPEPAVNAKPKLTRKKVQYEKISMMSLQNIVTDRYVSAQQQQKALYATEYVYS